MSASLPLLFIPRISQEMDYSHLPRAPQIMAALAVTFAGFILGTNLGWSSPVESQLQHNSSLNIISDNASIWYVNLSDDQMSWVGSLVNVGALLGSLSGGKLMDTFGRKKVLMFISAPLYLIGWLLIALAINPWMLYSGRVFAGAAGGVSCVTAPCYVNEISTPDMSGILGIMYTVMVCTGALVSSLLGLSLDWRWISGISALHPIILFLLLFLIPESPFFLVKQGRMDEAVKSLTWFRGSNTNLENEFISIGRRTQVDGLHQTKISDIIEPLIFKPVVVAIFLFVTSQLSGLNAVLFYAYDVFNSSSSTLDSQVSTVILYAILLVVTLISSFMVDCFGRRTLFLVSEGMTCISLFAMSTCLYIKEHNAEFAQTRLPDWLPLTTLILFIASYSIGVGPLPWLLTNEIIPAKFRGPGSSIAASANWGMSFVVTKVFVDMRLSLSCAGTFSVFGGFCLLGFVFALFFLPETKGKTPEMIQSNFSA